MRKHRGGAFHLNALGEGHCVFGRDQTPRDLRISRITQPMGAIRESELHGLGHHMITAGFIHRLEVETLQHVQHLDKVHPAGTGRREGNNPVTAVGGRHRLAQDDAVGLEIGSGHEAAVGLHPFVHGAGEGSAIEPVDPLPCDRPVSCCKVGLFEAVTLSERLAVPERKRRARD